MARISKNDKGVIKMKKDYSVLILGFFGSIYIVDFVKSLKKENPSSHIFFWGAEPEDKSAITQEYLDCYDEYCFHDLNQKFNRIPILCQLETIYLWRKNFNKFAGSKRFDVTNIHFIYYAYVYILDYIKKYSSCLVLTPWGSDVYRIGSKEKLILRYLYRFADYITGRNDGFTKDVLRIFKIPKSKFVQVFLGSSVIDYIKQEKDFINAIEAKKLLGINDSYVITCGYNANSAQNHLGIIEAINKVKDYLPQNIILLFPFTYGSNKEYVDMVKRRVEEYNLRALFFEDFLDIHHLFLLRQATDMFIHVQSTDAGNASLREYLFCEKKVINGEWIRYEDLEINGTVPYFIAKDLKSLDKTIMEAFKSDPINISEATIKIIEEKSWKSAIKGWDNFFSEIAS